MMRIGFELGGDGEAGWLVTDVDVVGLYPARIAAVASVLTNSTDRDGYVECDD